MAGTSNSVRNGELVSVRCSVRTEAELQAVRQQLSAILESPPFKTSKRCRALLSHVVDKVLSGAAEDLKERSLGIDVFHRDPQYDTNADPVVRTAAGEVRKKLAQYYYDVCRRPEIHIELPSGSYVPEFYRPAEVPQAAPIGSTQPASSLIQAGKRPSRIWLPVSCLLVGLLAGATADRVHSRAATPPITALDAFWRPLFSALEPVRLCVGHVTKIGTSPNVPHGYLSSGYELTSGDLQILPSLSLADSTALANVAGLFQSQNRSYTVQGESETTFSDLASGPSVLIGSFNDDWMTRMSDQLRFHFEADRATGQQWIVDGEKPGEKIGMRALDLSAADVKDAYAIISRMRDPGTGQVLVSLAGGSDYGTKVAGTFVSEPGYIEEFARRSPQKWQNANLQLVVSAPVADGRLGAPHVVYSYTW